jgi:hypothetical protein
MGNHDWYSKDSQIIELEFKHPRWIMPDYFFKKVVSLGNGHKATFIFMDASLLQYGYPDEGARNDVDSGMKANFQSAGWTRDTNAQAKQLAWLDKALQDANNDPYVFIISHYPSFTCEKTIREYVAYPIVICESLVNKFTEHQ